MKPTKFIVVDEYSCQRAPDGFLGGYATQNSFRSDMQNLIKERNFVKSVCKEKGMKYIPNTYTLYKLTKVKEFQL